MASAWFEKAGHSDPKVWELYHENAKRGRRLGVSETPGARTGSDAVRARLGAVPEAVHDRFDATRIGLEDGWSPIGPPKGDALTLSALSVVLGAADPSIRESGDVDFLIYINAVDALPVGLYRYRRAPRSLLHLGQGGLGREMMAALGDIDRRRRPAAVLFIVGALEIAAKIDGDRGYRRALVAAGRQARTIDLAAESAGIACREMADFYDREVDSLLLLDGLSHSALCVLALAPRAEP